jgi:hypothetical protein
MELDTESDHYSWNSESHIRELRYFARHAALRREWGREPEGDQQARVIEGGLAPLSAITPEAAIDPDHGYFVPMFFVLRESGGASLPHR